MSQILEDTARIGTFAVLGYFAYQQSRMQNLAYTVAGVAYVLFKQPKANGDHRGACGGVELLSGVHQPHFLEIALALGTFVLHAEHKLIHRYNIWYPAAFYAAGCFIANRIQELWSSTCS